MKSYVKLGYYNTVPKDTSLAEIA